MKKLLKFLTIIILVLFIKLSFTYTINEIIIYNYQNGNYNTKLIKTLYLLNFYQKYIAYYNEGNILYKTNNFDDAIQRYQIALTKKPPQNKVCDIRINLSLSIIKNSSNDNKTEILDNLSKAKNNLYEDNCASPIDDSGKSEDAEKLEEEIKQLEEQIKNNSGSGSTSSDPNESEENNENFTNIEEQLKENEQKSNSSRQDELTDYENMGSYEYYSGKRW